MAPGETAIFTATYAVTQADVDHGSIADTATATGTPSHGEPVTGDSNPVTVDVTQSAALSITKSASTRTVSMVGQTIDYTFTVVNTGNVTLTDVAVTDHPIGPARAVIATCRSLSSPTGTCSGASTTIVPGQTATFTGIYTVTAADLAHGSIADMATAAGSSPSGGTTSPPSDTVTVEETDVTVTKSASSQGGVVAGSSNPIVYTVKVANVGTATTTEPVVVTDAPPPGTTLVSGSPACTGGPPACALVLKGSTITWTIPAGVVPGSSYTLTFSVTANASNTAETITNTATWSGPSCGTSAATTCPTDTTLTPVSATPATPPIVPPPPAATPVASVVAFTGALLSQEWVAAVLAAVVGGACWSGRAGDGAVPVTLLRRGRTRTRSDADLRELGNRLSSPPRLGLPTSARGSRCLNAFRDEHGQGMRGQLLHDDNGLMLVTSSSYVSTRTSSGSSSLAFTSVLFAQQRVVGIRVSLSGGVLLLVASHWRWVRR